MSSLQLKNLKSSIELYEVLNWNTWSLQLKYLKSSIEIIEVFNWSIRSLIPFHYFSGWVWWVAVLPENKTNSASIKVEIELRLSLSITWDDQRRSFIILLLWLIKNCIATVSAFPLAPGVGIDSCWSRNCNLTLV